MPKLTQVKETKRGRYALFFDGEFAFSLDEDTFAMAGLHTGDELEEWQIHDLQTKSDTRKAVDKAMDLLALRDHAAGELYQKLCRSFDPHSAAAAVAKMQELNLLDDAGFARRRAAELLRKRKSRRAILDDLHAKGIDRGAAAGAGQCPRTGGTPLCRKVGTGQMAAGSCRFGTARVLPQRDPPGIGRCRDRRNRSVTQKSTHRRGKKCSCGIVVSMHRTDSFA
mgnify:CR=1 FL=1